jgi:hypothetical protein
LTQRTLCDKVLCLVSAMDRREASGLIQELTEIQSVTRATLHASGWQWMVIWAVAFFGAAVTSLVPAWQPLSEVYWVFATPIALLLTIVVSTRIDARAPVRQRSLPYWIVGLGITGANIGASALLPDAAVVVVVWVIIGLGFAGFALLERVEPAAVLLGGMAVVSGILGLVVENTFDLYPVLALSFSAALAGTITGMRVQSKR